MQVDEERVEVKSITKFQKKV